MGLNIDFKVGFMFLALFTKKAFLSLTFTTFLCSLPGYKSICICNWTQFLVCLGINTLQTVKEH